MNTNLQLNEKELTKKQLQLLYQLKKEHENTYQHSVNVSKYSVILGEKLSLEREDIEKLRIAGLYHDIGKLLIPNSILHKKGKLTQNEFEIIKKHPLYSYNLMIKNGFKDEDVLDIVKHHHERLDGLGYPDNLTKATIPFLTKIVSICDSYDAMQRSRAYKDEKDINYILSELINNCETQFDSYMVYNLIDILNKNNLISNDFKKGEKNNQKKSSNKYIKEQNDLELY